MTKCYDNEKPWWLLLAEDLANKPLDDVQITLDYEPTKEGDVIVVADMLNEFPMIMDLRMAHRILSVVWRDAPDEMPMTKLVATAGIMEHLDGLFWKATRFRYPKSKALSIRTHDGKLAIVEYEVPEGERRHPLEGIFGKLIQF